MEIAVWYCPKCDKETQNHRNCKTCGTKAVHQRFQCWPIPNTLEDDYFDNLFSPPAFNKKTKQMETTVKKISEFVK